MLEGDAAADYVGIWMRRAPTNAAKLRRDALRAARSATARGRLRFARAVRLLPRRARPSYGRIVERGTERRSARRRSSRAVAATASPRVGDDRPAGAS